MDASQSPHDLVFLPAAEVPVLERIRRLPWDAFEDFVAEIYRREGYLVEQTGRHGADGGYDLVLLRENISVLVQCKHWLTFKVGVAPVRELAGAMRKVGATGGVFVTTGAFTKLAREFASGMAIELVDGEALSRRFATGLEQPASIPNASIKEPSCPKCHKTMVWRTARKGPRPGERFWGCPDFPRCTGVRKAA